LARFSKLYVNGSSLRPKARRDAASVGVQGRDLLAHLGLFHWRPKSLVIEFCRGCHSGVRRPPGAVLARSIDGARQRLRQRTFKLRESRRCVCESEI
jgi:hypothetical protein